MDPLLTLHASTAQSKRMIRRKQKPRDNNMQHEVNTTKFFWKLLGIFWTWLAASPHCIQTVRTAFMFVMLSKPKKEQALFLEMKQGCNRHREWHEEGRSCKEVWCCRHNSVGNLEKLGQVETTAPARFDVACKKVELCAEVQSFSCCRVWVVLGCASQKHTSEWVRYFKHGPGLFLIFWDMTISTNWTDGFSILRISRHGISCRVISDESGEVNDSSTQAWTNVNLETMLATYADRDIFNANKVGMFHNLLRDQMFAFRGQPCCSSKASEQHVKFFILNSSYFVKM